MSGDGDQPDQEEPVSWSCSKGCGTSGTASTEAEANTARSLHEGMCNWPEDA